jgi:hypothetical protein
MFSFVSSGRWYATTRASSTCAALRAVSIAAFRSPTWSTSPAWSAWVASKMRPSASSGEARGVDPRTSLLHDRDEARVQVIEDRLHDATLLRCGSAERRQDVLVLAGLVGLVLDADLREQALEVQVHQDDADRARHRRRMRDDPVGGARDVVAARRGDVAERRDHRHVLLLLEADDLAVELVARGDPAAGAVDAEEDRLHAVVVLRLVELRLDARDRALLLDEDRRRAASAGR